MGTIGLIVRRARAGLGLLVTILLLAATTTAIIAGTLGYSQAAATTAARQALDDAVPTEAGLRVQTRLGADPAAQDAAAQKVITDSFAPVEVRIQRTLVGEGRPVTDQSDRLVPMASNQLMTDDADFTGRVQVVAGSWPTAGDGAGDAAVSGALHAGTAEAWGVAVGDVLDVGGVQVTVSATWRPADAQAAFWFGDPLVATGQAEGTAGPLIVAPAAITRFGDTPFVRWTVQPDSEHIEPEDMPLLAQSAASLKDGMDVPAIANRGITFEGDLAPTAATAGRNLSTARALNVIPVVLLLLVSVIAVVQIARLQSAARAGEVEVLIARGASRGQILRWTLLESVVVTALASALGIAAALAVMRAVPAGDQQSAVVVRAGLLTGAAVLVALVAISVLQVRALASRTSTDRSGRTRQVAALGTLVFTLAAAGLTWWQLRRYRSPLVTGDDGSLRTDLVAGAAPAMLLAAAAVITMALLGPASRLAEAVSRPTRRLTGHLAASQVSRRLVVYAVPVVLTILATGAATVSSLYASSSATLRSNLAEVGQGADVRVLLAERPVETDRLVALPDVSQVPGVSGSMPVWISDTSIAGTQTRITALPIPRLTQVAHLPEGTFTSAELAPLMPSTAGDAGPALPDGGGELTIPVKVEAALPDVAGLEKQWQDADKTLEQYCGTACNDPDVREFMLADERDSLVAAFRGPSTVGIVLLVSDPDGVGRQRVELPVGFELSPAFDAEGHLADPSTKSERTLTVDVPAGVGRRLVGIAIDTPQYGQPYQLKVTLDGVTTADGTNLLTEPGAADWPDPLTSTQEPVTPVFQASTGSMAIDPAGTLVLDIDTGLDATFDGPDERKTLTMTSEPPHPGSEGIAAAVTQAMADTNNLSVGSRFEGTLFGQRVPLRVASIVGATPGSLSPRGIMLDSATLMGYFETKGKVLGPPSEVWIRTSDPARTVEAVAGDPSVDTVLGPDSVSVTDAASAVRLVFWVSSAGAALLAITGIGAVAANLLRTRRPEVAVLRALGMTPRSQSGSRVVELLGVVGTSLLVGIGAGWLVGAMVIPDLASSTTLSGQVTLPAPLSLELPLWLAVIGVLAAALVVVLAVQLVRVRGQATDNDYREEIR